MTKAKRGPQTAFPPAFYSAGEQFPFLAKLKRSLEKRLSLTRMETLFEEVDLAIYLLAQGRDAEALEVAAFLPAHISFAGNHNIWCPTGNAIAVSAFLYRKTGNEAAARTQLERLIEHPSHADREPEFYEDMMTGLIPKSIEQASTDPSTKWACHRYARTIQRSIFWRETNVPGFHHYRFYGNEVVERLRDVGLESLRGRMSGMERSGATSD